MNYHQCKNGQQRPGSRSDCERCSGKRKVDPTSQTIMQQAQRNAELKATLQRMVNQFEGAAETQDDLDALAEARRVLK
jgi:small-conductance mechanosensitive channel